LEDLEAGMLEYTIVGEFLVNLKKKISRRDNEIIKVVELKKVKQRSKTIKKFVQEFRRTEKGNRYERRPLVEEFKRRMNKVIEKELIEAK